MIAHRHADCAFT
ncbi:hypothetical protein VCHC47A1_2178, partial [Vibrio cholerae HC-47A1]